jgi:hypothetical protein
MRGKQTIGILAQPLWPLPFGQCEKCGRWFAVKLVRKEKSALSGQLKTFRCKHCGHEETFASRHPPGAI